MEIHQLRYAVAVADEGAFGKAARRCKVSQPSLSVQVKKLETELGGPLFDRLGRGVRITPLGERFLPHARAVLLRLEAARASVAEEIERPTGPLRLGAIPTIAPFWLPKALPRLRAALPGTRVLFREGTTDALLGRLARGELDYALLSAPVPAADVELLPLFTEEFLLAVSADHAFASRKEIPLQEAAEESWILLEEMHCLRHQVLSCCAKLGLRIDTVLETSQVASLLGLVEAGLGISLVPEMAAEERPGIRYLPLKPPRPSREVVLAAHKDHYLPPAARKFASWAAAQGAPRPDARQRGGRRKRRSGRNGNGR